MQQSSTNGVQKAWLGGKDDPSEIAQKIKIWPHNQMVHAQTRILSRELDA